MACGRTSLCTGFLVGRCSVDRKRAPANPSWRDQGLALSTAGPGPPSSRGSQLHRHYDGRLLRPSTTRAGSLARACASLGKCLSRQGRAGRGIFVGRCSRSNGCRLRCAPFRPLPVDARIRGVAVQRLRKIRHWHRPSGARPASSTNPGCLRKPRRDRRFAESGALEAH